MAIPTTYPTMQTTAGAYVATATCRTKSSRGSARLLSTFMIYRNVYSLLFIIGVACSNLP